MSQVIIEPIIKIGQEVLNAIAQLKASFQQAETAAKQAGKAGGDSMKEASNEAKKQTGVLAQLRAELKKLEDARENAFDPASIRQYNREIEKLTSKIEGLEKLGTQQPLFNRIFGSAADFLKANIAIQSFDQVASTLGRGFKAAIDTEQFEQSLAILLGSTEKAQAKIKELTDFAAKTPFEMPQIQKATKTLLAFGIANEDLMPTLKRLGDVAAITGTDFGDLARMFGQIRAVQVAYTGDLNQFANAGIPIYEQLAKQLNTTEAGVKKLAETGAISFDIVNEAFRQFTSEGGKFADGMIKQSETLGGVLSTLRDSISILLMKAVQPLIPAIKAAASFFIELADSVGNFIQILIGLPKAIWDNREVLGLLLAGLALMNAELIKSSALFLITQARIQGMIAIKQAWAAATNLVRVATQGLNATLRANPIAFVIGLITTLAGVIGLLYGKFVGVRAAVDALWAGLKETGMLIYELIAGPFRAFGKVASGIAEILKGNFSAGVRKIGEGLKEAVTGNLKKIVQGVPAIGRAAAAAWNKAYAEEAKRGTGKAVKEKLAEEVNQRKAVIPAIQEEQKARAKYVKQLEFERKAIDSVTDSIKRQTEALRDRSREVTRAAELDLNVEPGFGRKIIEVEDERNKLILEAQKQRAEAEVRLAEQRDQRLKDLAQQKAKFEEELAKARFENADVRQILELERVLKTYETQITLVESDVKAEQLKINQEYQDLLLEIEKLAYNRRRVEAAKAAREFAQQRQQEADEVRRITEELTVAVLAASDDINKRKVAVSIEFKADLKKIDDEILKARERLQQIEVELGRTNITEEERNALLEEFAFREDVIRDYYIKREKIVRDWNKKDLELAKQIAKEKQDLLKEQEDEFERAIYETARILTSTSFELDFIDGYARALSQITIFRRKWQDTEAAQILEAEREYIESQLALFDVIPEGEEQSALQRIEIKRRTGEALTYEERRYLDRYEELLEQQNALEQKRLQEQAAFNQQRFSNFMSFAVDIARQTVRLIDQVINMQIAALDRSIQAQAQHVEEAERIAERGNTRQLALERERLEKLQQERAKFVRQQQALAAVELVINSAVAVAKAAAAGGPAAPITIALTLAALAVGLAQARAQARAAAQTGFKEGGYTGDGPVDKIVGHVHAREFVVNAKATEKWRPLLDAINKNQPVKMKDLAELAVIPHEISLSNLGLPEVKVVSDLKELKTEMAGIREDLDRVVNAINAIPQASLVIDEDGFAARVGKIVSTQNKRSSRR